MKTKRLQAPPKNEIDELVPVQARVRVGKPYDEIVSFEEITGAGPLVIATNGHTGLKHTLPGITGARVVRYASGRSSPRAENRGGYDHRNWKE